MKHPTQRHPGDLQLAAFSTGDVSFLQRFGLERHVNGCENCQEQIAAFLAMREELARTEPPAVNWDSLASEMRANIHLGLEAGACVRVTSPRGSKIRSVRLAVTFASLLLLAGAGLFMRDYRPLRQIAATQITATQVATGPSLTPAPEYRIPVLESSTSGIEMRAGSNSFAFLNRKGEATSQTVSAQGTVQSRDIDSDTGSVTIKNVYLQ
jgi:hypothetical protein